MREHKEWENREKGQDEEVKDKDMRRRSGYIRNGRIGRKGRTRTKGRQNDGRRGKKEEEGAMDE